jgi:hypothetical protein
MLKLLNITSNFHIINMLVTINLQTIVHIHFVQMFIIYLYIKFDYTSSSDSLSTTVCLETSCENFWMPAILLYNISTKTIPKNSCTF